MGKRHFKGNNHSQDKKRRRDNAEKWKQTRGDEQQTDRRGNVWGNTVTESARFDAFYKAQNFVSDGADWDSFLEHLKLPLPATFRINPDYAFSEQLRSQLMGFAGKTLTIDDQEIRAVEQIGWYPNGFGYKLGTDRRSIRKLEALTHLHKWLVQHTENGNITRQEAVSMIPPLALDVAPGHKCLDMCAAPGSKTSQLLEIVNRSLSLPVTEQGLVVANDSDTDRAYMLVHQCKRINSPLLIVTTHKGQMFPSITDTIPAAESATGQATTQPFFDRVLCDVPCSGDGTLRKNPTIWGKWATSMATTLHPLQLMIANRGLQLLKNDGLMVYSTCSLSPYENEAVVAELLRAAKGTLELVDARQFLPLFKARAGMSSWHVLDDYSAIKKEMKDKKHQKMVEKGRIKTPTDGNEEGADDADVVVKQEGDEGEVVVDEDIKVETIKVEVDDADNSMQVDSEAAPETATAAGAEDSSCPPHQMDYSDVTDPNLLRCIEMGMTYYSDYSKVPAHLDSKVRKSFFPPTDEEKEWMHLERCLRCVPQDEDTGGFFVATLRKIGKPAKAPKAKPVSTPVPETETVAAVMSSEPVEASTHAAAVAAASAVVGAEGSAESSAVAAKPLFNTQKGLVDFHQWDEADFNKVATFYGLDATLPAESMFVREDFSTTSKNAKNNSKCVTKSKSVYFIPHSARALMSGDKDERLKIVTAGVKMFERKDLQNGETDYRLLQEGVAYIVPHISRRKVNVPIQDFCNILGGGLVSYSTLSQATINAITLMQPQGVVICIYEYNPADVIAPVAVKGEGEEEVKSVEADTSGLETPSHSFYAICWKGGSRTLNVMCGKVEIESMKHQLEALNVLRPKISATRHVDTATATSAEVTASGSVATNVDAVEDVKADDITAAASTEEAEKEVVSEIKAEGETN